MAGIAFGAAFVAMVAAGFVVVLRTDRKRTFQHGQVDSVGTGAFAASVPVVIAQVPSGAAAKIARQALRNAGCSEVHESRATVVGWTGSAFTNIPRWAEYQVAVEVVQLPDGMTEFICCSRPRFSSSLMNLGRSNQLAQRIATEVSVLAESTSEA